MAIGLATGVGGAAAATAFGASVLAAFLAYSLCGALGVMVSGLAHARMAQGARTSEPQDSVATRDLARSLG